MARGLRIDGPGLIHHVTFRGVERRDIFVDDDDREELLNRTDRLMCELLFRCFGWVFMPNHVHFVVQTGSIGLPRLMARLGTGYVRYFNRRHGRVGHLWQGRYWSRPIENDLETVVAYVHANPIRAGLVREEDAARYRWSGLSGIAGTRPLREFERWREGLDLGDVTLRRARVGRSARGLDVERLVVGVCRELGVAVEDVRSRRRSRRIREARAAIVRRAVIERGVRQVAVAKALGITPSAVSNLLSR